MSIPIVHLPLAECPTITSCAIGRHPGGTRGTYSFHDTWCVHLYTYHGELIVDGVPYPLAPGTCTFQPPGAVHTYCYGEPLSTHAFAHFHAPPGPHETASVPFLQELGPRFSACYHALETVIRFRATHQRRADARLYDLLFTLVEQAQTTPGRHPVIKPLVEWIDLHLGERFTTARLCREFALSHNHLNRICQRDLGCTIAAYVNQRRVRWATQLLAETTLPVKVIAAELGYTDLAQFSKLISRHTGQPPRQLR